MGGGLCSGMVIAGDGVTSADWRWACEGGGGEAGEAVPTTAVMGVELAVDGDGTGAYGAAPALDVRAAEAPAGGGV
jgi:hypothetical protein